MNLNNHNKKGAVEMSLNLIIMLVIGLTVLGLIIAFVTGFLGQAEDSVLGSLTPDDSTKLEQVQRETGNFVISPSNLNVKRGDSAKLYVKVENPTAAAQTGVFAGGEVTTTTTESFHYTATGSPAGISVEAPPISLQPSEVQAIPMIVEISDTTAAGNYFLTFSITIDTETYTKVVTVVVE